MGKVRKTQTQSTVAWIKCTELFLTLFKHRSPGTGNLSIQHSLTGANSQGHLIFILMSGMVHLNPLKSHYAYRTGDCVISLLSLLKGSVSPLVSDKEESFPKSVTQNRESKSILAYLWEADLH